MKRAILRLLLGAWLLASMAAAAVASGLLRVVPSWQAQAPFLFYRFEDDFNTRLVARCLEFAKDPGGPWGLLAVSLTLAIVAAYLLLRPITRLQLFLLHLAVVAPLVTLHQVRDELAGPLAALIFMVILWLWSNSLGKVPVVWRVFWLVSFAAAFGATGYFHVHAAAGNLTAYHLYKPEYTAELELYGVWGALAGWLVLSALRSAKLSGAGVFHWLLAGAGAYAFCTWSVARFPDVQTFAPATRMKAESDRFPPNQGDGMVGRIFTDPAPVAFSFEPRPGQADRLIEVFPNVTRTRVTDSEAALQNLMLQDWMKVKLARGRVSGWLQSDPYMAREPVYRATLDATRYDPFAENIELMILRNNARDTEDFDPDLHRQVLQMFSARSKRQEVLEESAILLENAKRVNLHLPGHFNLGKLEAEVKQIEDGTGADDRKIAGVKGRLAFDPMLLDPGHNLSSVAYVGISIRYPEDPKSPSASPLVAYFPVQPDGSFDVRGLYFGKYALVLILLKEGFTDPNEAVLQNPVPPIELTPERSVADLGTIRFVRGLEAYSWFEVK